ncbi:MAG: GNAT family N-acetyltransferase [Nevskia sp.]|nr:GNAT family N-acetyltransferase [Nevskia sp.]
MTAAAEIFDDLETLPPDCAELFAAGARHCFQFGRPWFRTVLAEAMPAGARPLFLLCRTGTGPGVLFVLRTLAGGVRLEGLSTLYSCLYQPLAAALADPADLRAAGRALGDFCRRWGRVRLDALDGGWPGLAPLLEGVRDSGLAVLRFDHFGNWHEDVAGRSWADYLAARPGALRETIRRRAGQAERDPRLALETIDSAAGLEAGIAAYEEVYARSWKNAEPFPRFSAALMRAAAAEGALRLGLLRLDNRPVAAQYWVLAGGTATVLKLAHDEAARAHSPGTVLTAAMIRGLLERDRIAELDFGRGDDAYKSLWAASRRQRVGVVLANPRRPAGLLALARHGLGRAVRSWQ